MTAALRPVIASAFCALSALVPLRGQEPAVESFLKDRTYSQIDGEDLKLDLALPANFATGSPLPAVVYFHGGGWQAGRRQDAYEQIKFLASKGFVGITVSYRFAPQYKWPAQVHDAKTAVRFVRTHAAEFNIDPDRIAAAGDSAGGYLALMLGLTAPDDELEGPGEWSEASSRVQAVVSYYSVADFTKLKSNRPPKELTPEEAKRQAAAEAITQAYYKKSGAQVIEDWTGTLDPADPIWKQLSPVNYVSRGDSPVLIIQGDADPVVSVDQARQLNRTLTAAGVPHDMLIIEGGGHGFTRPQAARANAKMLEFLRLTLAPPK
ncbi:MAG: alpha/beta hydrolase [Opitutaceae bacterium]|nr:alpha/beta hydrolase [Opitutaceae bacterium]